MRREIYNLEFPSWCPKLSICGYEFSRVPDYEQRLASLQHLAPATAEFATVPTTGQHAITAVVERDEPEPPAVLEWSGSSTTAIWDILLILSLFTRRDVFAAPASASPTGAIIRDPRVHSHGGLLRISIPYVRQPIEPEPFAYDIGFEQALNRVYDLIRDPEWRQRYRGGYFLFLADQAFRMQPLESSFVTCWTIWEHLFSVHNDRWLSPSSIRALRAQEKITFILSHYDIVNQIDSHSRARLSSLSAIRHRLVHFGRFPAEPNALEDALLFIALTEWVLARVLGLQPSNALNTQESLQEFLSRQ